MRRFMIFIISTTNAQVVEEAGIRPVAMTHQGILTFVWDDNPRPWEVHVYNIADFSGQPTESDEMKPIWFKQSNLPFHKMWADDEYWYPLFLAGKRFQGVFAFENTHSLVWHHVREVSELMDTKAFVQSACKS